MEGWIDTSKRSCHQERFSIDDKSPYHSARMPPPHNPGGSLPSKYGSCPLKRRHSKRSASRRTSSGTRSRSAPRKSTSPWNRGGDTLVNQRIRLRQFDVTFCYRPKCLKLLDGIFPLI